MSDEEFERMLDDSCAKTGDNTLDFAELQARWWNDRPGSLGYADCPICKNRGVIYHAYKGDDVMMKGCLLSVECSCMNRRRNLECIEKSGLSESIKTLTFDTYKIESGWQSHVKNVAKDYLNYGGSNWFMICGQVGSGKTHICTAIVGELIKRGRSVIYLPFRDAIPELKRNTMDDAKYSAMMSKWKMCDVLYIDDLFKGTVTAADISILFELFDFRYRNRLQTIISTEKTLAEQDTIDEAIASRIAHLCGRFKLNIDHDENRNIRKKMDEQPQRREA